MAKRTAKVFALSPRAVSWVIAGLIRGVAATITFKVRDPDRVCADLGHGSLIWAFWHNRLFLMPFVCERFLPHRHGVGLSSASGDGAFIAATFQRFGIGSVRGSTSRRSREAFLKLARHLRAGDDVGLTPDGPRGPRYQLQAGAVKLAAVTGARVLPIHLRFSRAWKFRSWDQFRLPWPFSTVEIEFGPVVSVGKCESPEELEEARAALEAVLRAGVEGSV